MRPRNRNGKDKGFIYTTRPGQTDTNPPPSKTHIIIWPWLPARQLVWNSARLMTLHSDPSMQVHFDDVSLYGTPKEEPMPNIPIVSEKVSANFLKSQLQSWFQPTDNRLAMKLFGSRKALVKERIRQKTSGHWVIHPCSSFRWVPTINTERSWDMSSTNTMISRYRFYWDLCMLLLLVANLIILPVAISFFNDDLSTRWIAFNCLSDTIFLIDIVVNFRTGNAPSTKPTN